MSPTPSQSTRTLALRIGKRALLRSERTPGLTFGVLIVDVIPNAFGAIRYVVTPTDGDGQGTVDGKRLTFTEGLEHKL